MMFASFFLFFSDSEFINRKGNEGVSRGRILQLKETHYEPKPEARLHQWMQFLRQIWAAAQH